MNIGKSIRDLRKGKGLSQVELAQTANLTQAALSAIENGARPNPDTLERICKVLGVPESLVYVFSMEKDEVPEEKRVLYDSLFPVIKDLIMQIAVK